MDKKAKKYLIDIIGRIERVENYFDNIPQRYEYFVGESPLNSAIRYDIAIIGEAVNGALKICPDLAITDARKIVGMRNLLVHQYNDIEDEIVWSVVVRHLPKLKQELLRILQSPNAGEKNVESEELDK